MAESGWSFARGEGGGGGRRTEGRAESRWWDRASGWDGAPRLPWCWAQVCGDAELTMAKNSDLKDQWVGSHGPTQKEEWLNAVWLDRGLGLVGMVREEKGS